MQKQRVILIAAGGTGGHVFPALAVAQAFQAQGARIVWLGTMKGIESKVIPKANIPLEYLSVTGLRGKNIGRLLLAPLQLVRALWQAMRVIKRHQPDLVMGFGGFVCGPAGLAAWLMRKKLVLHEQNAIPGLTNRLLKPLAVLVFASFPQAFKPAKKVIVTGNPVRAEITALPLPAARFAERSGALNILVLGGSLGALRLNQVVPQALQLLTDLPMSVWHQCGETTYAQTQEFYQAVSSDYRLTPFIDNMAQAYAWADLVICRAGATTVTELMAVGLGAILVPYPLAVDDHQTANGLYLVKAGAAVILPQADLTADLLAQTLRTLRSRAVCLEKAIAAQQCYLGDAVQKILTNCEEIYRG